MNGFFRIREYEQVESTNDTVRQMALAGESEGFVAVAKRQTMGKGRMGRGFFSPNGGLYMSVLLKPRISPEKTLRITTMAAVAVCEAIEDYCGKTASIKWVNDIIVDGKKVCGILTQSAVSGENEIDFAVLGIGLNVLSPIGGFPDDIKNKAGALFEGTYPPDAKNALMTLILDAFLRYYRNMDSADYQIRYADRMMLKGRFVDVIKSSSAPIRARVLGVDEYCALEVQYDDGRREKLSSGEVGVRYDYE